MAKRHASPGRNAFPPRPEGRGIQASCPVTPEAKGPPVHPPELAYPCCLPALGRFTRWTPHEGLDHSVPGAESGHPATRSTPRSVSCRTEDSPRGLGRTLGKRVGLTPSRVRISYPPPPVPDATRSPSDPTAASQAPAVNLARMPSTVSETPGAEGCSATRASHACTTSASNGCSSSPASGAPSVRK
jgi:hypothetical protein